MKRAPPSASLITMLFVMGIFTLTTQRATAAGGSGDTPQARRATDALNLLEARGYCSDLQEKKPSAFAEFRPQGDDFAATIVQKDRRYTVTVNPDTGRVSREN